MTCVDCRHVAERAQLLQQRIAALEAELTRERYTCGILADEIADQDDATAEERVDHLRKAVAERDKEREVRRALARAKDWVALRKALAASRALDAEQETDHDHP